MLLKKQTVWLLTMLSLVVVLSVYYVTMDPGSTNVANEGKEDTETTSNPISEDDWKIITDASGDEVFDMIRLSLQEERDKMKEELTMQAASPELSMDEKNELVDKMNSIDQLVMKERTLESSIKGLGYKDALVTIEDNLVNITVKAEEYTKADAVEIIQYLRDEISTQYIPVVEFDTN